MARGTYEALVGDLTYLRKGAGLTLARLAEAPEVMHVCGGDELPTETVLQRLVTAVHSLRDIPTGPALSAAYGVDIPAEAARGELGERRTAFARTVDRSADRVRQWEDTAIAELGLRLLSRYYAGADTGKLVLPHGGFLLQDLHVVTIIRNRVFAEAQQTRTILSLVDGARGFRYGSYSPTELTDVHGATATTEVHEGGVMHQLNFPVPLRRGQLHSFRFTERVPAGASDGSATPDADFSGQTFESPTLRYQVELCFLGDVPKTVWAYDKLSRIERPGQPHPQNTIPVDGRAVIGAVFTELYGGLASGVAWRW